MTEPTSTGEGGLREAVEAEVRASFARPIPGYVSAHKLRALLATHPEPAPTVEGGGV